MIVKEHYQLSDDEYERQFERFTFKPRLFTHEAHLRLAYIHINKYGSELAEQHMSTQIRKYADYYGADEKFNLTVTIASIKILAHFIRKSKSTSFNHLIKEFPEMLKNFKGIIGRHYSFDVFGDPEAKKVFIQPDLLPFD